jgi:serine/threonine protein kinase
MWTRPTRGKRTSRNIMWMATILCILGKFNNHITLCREILDNRYIILKKMGWGHFSTVWLAFNFKDKRLYALKVMRSQLRYQDHGLEEETLNRVIAENHDNPLWVKSLKERIKGEERG